MNTIIHAKIMQICCYILLILVLAPLNCYALREARPIGTDSRIKVMVYHKDDVFKFVGYYGYQTSIELSPDEEVASVSMGDTTAWQVVPSGNLIFIKPIDDQATTNMTLITNKRTYFFELYAEETNDIRNPEMAFTVRFIYPEEEDNQYIRSYAIRYVPWQIYVWHKLIHDVT